MSQKDVFLQSEGDAWFERNHEALLARAWPDGDNVLREVLALGPPDAAPLSVLEVGCGEALRLAWLQNERRATCCGIEPSARAVAAGRARGVDVRQGTADALPFADHSVDVVIFGFCLYLCDRDDLFRIASEADRVLKMPGWVIIEDFFSPTPVSRVYHHRPGVLTHKMDYRTLFDWHPHYHCLTHKVRHHSEPAYTDDPNEWVATSVIRKAAAPSA